MRDFDVEHEKRMHLIVARRDLTGFQHLHPTQAADGTLVGAGAPRRGRLLPRCSPTSRTRTRRRRSPPTCASTATPTCGRCPPRGPPRRATAATTSGSTPAAPAPAGRPTCASRSPATARRSQTEPYLGAGGHLVALREGDLAFLHVHPTEQTEPVGFDATFPTAGRYRLFLQFKHEGRVQTAAFTQEVR